MLIGPATTSPVRGIAVPTADAFETPLGRVPVDRDALSAIADLPFVVEADAAHAPEHALEVELPFLQTLLGSFARFRCWSAMPIRGRSRRCWNGCGASRTR